MDNPGFGESKQCIAQATSESWESSTAYIYLTSKDSVGKLLEAEVFKSFYDKGEKLYMRYAICANQYHYRFLVSSVSLCPSPACSGIGRTFFLKSAISFLSCNN